MSEAITTLGQLLEKMGVQARFYDLGRRIEKLSREQFQSFEDLRTPYPRPYLQKALIGVVFWQKETADQPSVWCLRLPLDEQGILVPSERDQFLQHLLVAVGNNLDAAKKNEQLTAVLEGNPYVFTPPQEKQAAFNAKIKAALKLTPSQHYAPCLQYFAGDDYNDWQNLALQGIADVAARWQQSDCHSALIKALPQIPSAVLVSLCQCLEHEGIDLKLSEILSQRLQQAIDSSGDDANHSVTAACLRGLSFSVSATLLQSAVDSVLHSGDQLNIEIIATLATRLAPQLLSGGNPLVFMELLAKHSEASFIGVMSELLYQPALREPFLAAMRLPDRTQELSEAIGALLRPSQNLH